MTTEQLLDTLNDLKSLADREYRHIYASHITRETLALQIRSLREQRGWNQAELGSRCPGKMAQTRISLLENPDISSSSINIRTLERLGEAFDVALLCEYVPFSELQERIRNKDRFNPPAYDEDVRRVAEAGVMAKPHVATAVYSAEVDAAKGFQEEVPVQTKEKEMTQVTSSGGTVTTQELPALAA